MEVSFEIAELYCKNLELQSLLISIDAFDDKSKAKRKVIMISKFIHKINMLC